MTKKTLQNRVKMLEKDANDLRFGCIITIVVFVVVILGVDFVTDLNIDKKIATLNSSLGEWECAEWETVQEEYIGLNCTESGCEYTGTIIVNDTVCVKEHLVRPAQ